MSQTANMKRNSSYAIINRLGIFLPLSLVVIYWTLWFYPVSIEAGEAPFLNLMGRFHPLALHFPIVLIVILTAFILIGRYQNTFTKPIIIKSLLISSCVFSLIAIIAGYLLFVSEKYSGDLVNNHLIGGLITGTCISISTAIYFYNLEVVSSMAKNLFFVMIAFTNLALVYTSHLGGSLTHGEDYLSAPMASLFPSNNPTSIKPVEELLLYEDIIATILETKCANCHNENKTKGDLLLTNHPALLKAGKSGEIAVVPGSLDQSELISRILLPEDDEDRMPPEGKPELTQNEIDLISFWVEEGASNEIKFKDLKNEVLISSINDMLPSILKTQYRMMLEQEAFEAAGKELNEIADQLGVLIEEDKDAEGRFFGLKMKFPPSQISNESFLPLMPFSSHFSRISLASSNITDDELFFLGKMPNLRRLVLQKTAINGEGLPYLQALKDLKVLNLSFTPLEDGHLLHLLNFPSLEKVYLFGTPVKKEVIEALQKHQPQLEIILEEGPFY